MKLLKKGQITLFIILGIVIITAIALGFYFKEKISKTEVRKEAAVLSSLPPDLELLREEISECTTKTSEEALLFVGQQGGYFESPQDAINVEGYYVALAIKDGKNILISEEQLKEEIGAYISQYLPQCVNSLDKNGLQILNDNQLPSTTINLEMDKTDFSITYKITAQKEDNSYNLFEPYEFELPYRIKKVYDASSKITDIFVKNPDEIKPLEFLDYGVNVTLFNFDNDSFVLVIDDNGIIDVEDYQFRMGAML